MIKADLHLHTCYSHGRSTPLEMYREAQKKGLELIGFSEHSPRPRGFDYTHEYREQLSKFLPQYIREVTALKQNARTRDCQVLLGLEMDWLAGQTEFISQALNAYDYDYVIGSVHFLGKWGFDDGEDAWKEASQETCEERYQQYFAIWKDMLASGLFNIAAHPDLIKIFSIRQFRKWIKTSTAKSIVEECLKTLKTSAMAMEISSAGLRKACAEIYPGPEIMQIAADLKIPVSLASDAHCTADLGADFEELARYAKSFGFKEQTIYNHGHKTTLPF